METQKNLSHCGILQEAESIIEQVDDIVAKQSKADTVVLLPTIPTFLLQRSVVKVELPKDQITLQL